MKKFILIPALLLAACNGTEKEFQAGCMAFAQAKPDNFGADPKTDCDCLLADVSKMLDKDGVTVLGLALQMAGTDENAAQDFMDSYTGADLEEAIESAADVCGLD